MFQEISRNNHEVNNQIILEMERGNSISLILPLNINYLDTINNQCECLTLKEVLLSLAKKKKLHVLWELSSRIRIKISNHNCLQYIYGSLDKHYEFLISEIFENLLHITENMSKCTLRISSWTSFVSRLARLKQTFECDSERL